MVLPMHLNPEPFLLSLSCFDLAETDVRGTAKGRLKQGAYLTKNIVQAEEVHVMWLWHLCYVIQTVKIILEMGCTMYINAYTITNDGKIIVVENLNST